MRPLSLHSLKVVRPLSSALALKGEIFFSVESIGTLNAPIIIARVLLIRHVKKQLR